MIGVANSSRALNVSGLRSSSISASFNRAIRSPGRYTTFRGPNPGPEWNSFSGPESGPESNNFSGPGALGCECFSRGSLRPPFQSAHLCPPAIFSGPEWNDFFGPEPSARMERFFEARTGSFFLWRLNTLCKLDFFVFWGSKA